MNPLFCLDPLRRIPASLDGIILGLFAVGLLATGALKAVQLSSIIVTLPLMPVLILMVVSFLKWIR